MKLFERSYQVVVSAVFFAVAIFMCVKWISGTLELSWGTFGVWMIIIFIATLFGVPRVEPRKK